MKLLFVHQNFPGQYRHLATHYASDPTNTVVALREARPDRPLNIRGLRLLEYQKPQGANPSTHHYLRDTEAGVRRGQMVARSLMLLRQQGFRPDVICVHPAWGEGLFLKDVFPDARVLSFWEFYYTNADLDFDREWSPTLDKRLQTRVSNATQLMSFATTDWGVSPTVWQRNQYPPPWRALISVIHDGVNTKVARPDAQAIVKLEQLGLQLTRQDEVVTYVARNLEPYRGFHVFMRALPELLRRRTNTRVLVIGGDEVSYGRSPWEGQTWRQKMLAEVGADVDMSRVHFLGIVPYPLLLEIFQVSSAHVYLTYPFVLSWSMLEAMACECLVIGSRTPPVEEVITDEVNGLLVDFFSTDQIVEKICRALQDREALLPIRQLARQTIIERYDLHRVCLPQQLSLIGTLASRW
jgi:glycosyltransferase involved in cell wall biosynthesis